MTSIAVVGFNEAIIRAAQYSLFHIIIKKPLKVNKYQISISQTIFEVYKFTKYYNFYVTLKEVLREGLLSCVSEKLLS